MVAARCAWKQRQKQLDPDRLIFIDETGTSTNMARLRGRCPRGERLIGKVPHGHWKITTFVAALRRTSVTAPFVIDEPMNGEIFAVYLERCLVPTLRPGDIVVMDNLSVHKSDHVRRTIEAAGAEPDVPAALFARSQSNRNGLRKTQSPSAKSRRAIDACTLGKDRINPRSLHSGRMPKLLHSCRIRVN